MTSHERSIHALNADGIALEALDQSHDLIALLDASGSIVLTNAAWRAGARNRRGGTPTECGANYLAVCEQSGASAVAAGIRAVLQGHVSRFELEYPCHSPVDEAWFVVEVRPLDEPGSGVIVTHADVTARVTRPPLQDRRQFDPVTMLATAPAETTGVPQMLADAQTRGRSLAVVTITLTQVGEIEARFGRRLRDEVIIRTAARVLRVAHQDVALIRPSANQLVLFSTVVDPQRGERLRRTVAQALEADHLIWSTEVQSAVDVSLQLTNDFTTVESMLHGAAELVVEPDTTESMTDTIARLECHIQCIGSEVRAADVDANFSSARDSLPSALTALKLTARQREIVQRLADGERVPTIAAALYISRSTVRNHLANVYQIAGVHSQSELLGVLRAS